jgi:hypothetical protein
MIERQQVNLRLERELVDALDAIATTENVDRTEIARRILVDGVRRSRVDRALRDYAGGRVTAWKAAGDAGVSLYEMLDRIHEAGIPYELDPADLERLAEPAPMATRVGELSAPYSGNAGADSESGIDELRERHRPAKVETLFVGESSPAQGTHFYRANSNLFRATRAAFALARGDDAVPSGEAFLRYFRDRGCWLVDLADEPVNRLPDAARRAVVERGVERLAELIGRERPRRIVVVKRDVGDYVRRAMAMAGVEDAPLTVLPFPVRQWTRHYQDGLAKMLGERSRGGRKPG